MPASVYYVFTHTEGNAMNSLHTISLHDTTTNTRTWMTWDGNFVADIVTYESRSPKGWKSARFHTRKAAENAARKIDATEGVYVDVVQV